MSLSAARFFAVVPAAGRGTRMGTPKLTLDVAGRPMITHVVQALHVRAVDAIVVVVPATDSELAVIVQRAGAFALPIDKPTRDMRETIEIGLRWLHTEYAPVAIDAVLISPADLPGVRPDTVTELLACYSRGDGSIVVPRVGNRRGHPLLIAWHQVCQLFALPANVGLNQLLRGSPQAVYELSVPAPGLLDDIDTPADLERVRRGEDANHDR